MRTALSAAKRTEFDESTHTLTIQWQGADTARGDLRTQHGRAAIESFFARYCADELRGPPRVLYGDGHSFSDVASKVVSIINLASVASVERAVRLPVNPLRFRGHVYVSCWAAWREFDLLGRIVAVGKTAKLKIVKRIQRCAATDVDPDTGIRDLTIPRTLLDNFDHTDCGVYAEVTVAGEITPGDAIAPTSQ